METDIEKLRREYISLEHHNICFTEFVKEKKQKEEKNVGIDLSLKISSVYKSHLMMDIPPRSREDIPRPVVIDAANVMHSGSVYRRYESNETVPDVMSLLSLIRYFNKNRIPCIAVISPKYLAENGTNYKEALEELIKNHICLTVLPNSHDDVTCLKLAKQLHGIIASWDWFRDHQHDFNDVQWLGVDWNNLGNNKYHLFNEQRHFMADKYFIFKDRKKMLLSREMCQRMIYVNPNYKIYELIKSKHVMTDERINEISNILDRLIYEGIEKCPKKMHEIMNSPYWNPTALKDEDDDDEDY